MLLKRSQVITAIASTRLNLEAMFLGHESCPQFFPFMLRRGKSFNILISLIYYMFCGDLYEK